MSIYYLVAYMYTCIYAIHKHVHILHVYLYTLYIYMCTCTYTYCTCTCICSLIVSMPMLDARHMYIYTCMYM